MDSLTQIVLGAAVGEAVLGRKVGNKAILWGAVAGTIPDLDVIARYFTDGITANEIHRGFSHSIVFCVLAAPILGWLINKLHAKENVGVKGWTKLFLWGLVTHPLLDAHTTWGTQLFWPLDLRLAYKNIFVADPIYTLPFLLCVLVAMFYNRTSPKRRSWNNLGLILSSSYMVITLILKFLAYQKIEDSLIKQKIEYVEIETRPTPLNAILWAINVETKDSYLTGYYSLFDSHNNIDFSEFPKNYHLIDSIRDEKVIKQLIKISDGWYMIQQKKGDLYFNDLRFGQMGMDGSEAPFVYSYLLQEGESGETIAIENLKTMDKGFEMFNELVARVKGI